MKVHQNIREMAAAKATIVQYTRGAITRRDAEIRLGLAKWSAQSIRRILDCADVNLKGTEEKS